MVTLLSSLRINCQLIDFHRPTTADGKHPELFDWVLRYFEERRQQPPLYLQHQGMDRSNHCLNDECKFLTFSDREQFIWHFQVILER